MQFLFSLKAFPWTSFAFMFCQAPTLQILYSMPIFRTYSIVYQYIFPMHLRNKPFFEFRFLLKCSPTWDSLRTRLQFAQLRWRSGGGRLHTILMVRLLQITHDTSSDDIFQPLPCWMASPGPHYHPPTTTNTLPQHTRINSPSLSCHNSTAEIAASSALTWLTPLSRCWIWSNHSQSSLNISFFKQNRGSKFHHSMTRSVADNSIKPIPAYPEGAISWGTAGRWDANLQKGVNLPWSTALFVSQLYSTASGCWRRPCNRYCWGSAIVKNQFNLLLKVWSLR